MSIEEEMPFGWREMRSNPDHLKSYLLTRQTSRLTAIEASGGLPLPTKPDAPDSAAVIYRRLFGLRD